MSYCVSDDCDKRQPCPLHGCAQSEVIEESVSSTVLSEFTQENCKAWDVLAQKHSETYHIDKLLSGTSLLCQEIVEGVGNVRGKTLVHLLCHIGTDTLSWALLGAKVTGVDISPQALKCARELATAMKIDAHFIEADILHAKNLIHETYDIVFSSTGVLCWLPSLKIYAETVRKLLKPGGIFYLHDGHPFAKGMFENRDDTKITGDYFRREPAHFPEMDDYTDPNLLVPGRCHEWHWTLGDVISAFCAAGLRIVSLEEFPQFFYAGYTPYDVTDNKVERYPCTFSLKATL